MSIMTSVALLANRLIAPSVPAGTIAALATISPPTLFNVDTTGIVCPVGHAVK